MVKVKTMKHLYFFIQDYEILRGHHALCCPCQTKHDTIIYPYIPTEHYFWTENLLERVDFKL